MKRVHEHFRQSGEIIYCDATTSLDRFNCPTLLLSTSTPTGAIPLGVVITSTESESALTEAFIKITDFMPGNAFYGRGSKQGQRVCFTDDSQTERESLHKVWPNTVLLLCVFHSLQAWWRWLWGKKQEIEKDDRKVIINLIKKLVYTTSPEEFECSYKGTTIY